MSTSDSENRNIENVDNGLFNKPSKFGTRGFFILLFSLGLLGSAFLGWFIFPKLLYWGDNQPFNFNHALHLEEVSEGCTSCHYFRDDGSFAGIPKNDSCIECHEELIGDSDDEKTFVEEYLGKNREVSWYSYFKQPDCVFFSHAAHLKGSNRLECVICHGNIGESENCEVYEENRITKYSRNIWGKNIAGIKFNSWDSMKMNDCANCHASMSDGITHKSSVQTGRDACFVCHK